MNTLMRDSNRVDNDFWLKKASEAAAARKIHLPL